VARPGGNLTGFSMYEYSIGGKWVDLLKAAAPGLARVAVMFNPDTSPQSKFFMRSVETAALSLGVQASAMPVRTSADIEPAIASFARKPNGGLILPTDTFIRKLIADLAARHHLPALGAEGDFAKDGGLMYYSAAINVADQMRQAAGYNHMTALPLTPSCSAGMVVAQLFRHRPKRRRDERIPTKMSERRPSFEDDPRN
jgi:putative ABC transport system substrate-binding protein